MPANYVLPPRGKKVDKTCRCGNVFQVRAADVARGWGKFCSKSCKAKEQEKRTGQYSDLLHRESVASLDREEGLFTDAHLFSNEEHDCNKGGF